MGKGLYLSFLTPCLMLPACCAVVVVVRGEDRPCAAQETSYIHTKKKETRRERKERTRENERKEVEGRKDEKENNKIREQDRRGKNGNIARPFFSSNYTLTVGNQTRIALFNIFIISLFLCN